MLYQNIFMKVIIKLVILLSLVLSKYMRTIKKCLHINNLIMYVMGILYTYLTIALFGFIWVFLCYSIFKIDIITLYIVNSIID